MKRCSKCRKLKPLEDFGNNSHHLDGLQSYCKECGNKARRGKYKDVHKKHNVQNKYGLSVSEYDEIISRGCEVCGSTEKLHLDHDHTSGKVRGCLCQGCNLALGLMGDDPERLRKLADYMEEHHA